MNRKLHHVRFALGSSLALLLLGLAMAEPLLAPGAPSGDGAGGPLQALVSNAPGSVAGAAIAPLARDAGDSLTREAAGSRRSTGPAHRIRQSMAMPFFSFAPRG